MTEHRPLTKPEKVVLESLSAGLSEDKAYLAGYRIARRWKPETLRLRASRFFSDERIKYFIDFGVENLPAEKLIDHDFGRPSKYRHEYVQVMLDYFDVPAIIEKIHEDKKSGEITRTYRATDLPTLAGFCRKIGICRETLYGWISLKGNEGVEMYPDLINAYKLSKECCEDILTINTLNGNYNSGFAKFVAQNLLDWRESRDLTIKGDVANPLQIITKEMSAEEAAQIYRDELDKE